ETGLYNFNARLYDPAVGRFISPDPAVPDLSNSKNPWNYDPQMLNRYAYCRNNPLIYVDPTGLVMEDAGDDDDQYGEGPSAGGSGNGRDADGTAAGQSGRNASQTGPGEDEESDTPGKSRKGDKGTTVVGWCDLGIDNPLDNPPGQMVRDEDGNYTYVNPQGPNRNWGKIATGSLMTAAGIYTTAVSAALFFIAGHHFQVGTIISSIEGFHASYIGGIYAGPGPFMIIKGAEIVREGWRGE
ncbi:MAG TPA: RHS repeat-associated core domain-containing protein, partial [Syntrophales bacterium]|nr:RHS repeat-associated core domain-containing protein [Syntrophales bacterium]